MPEEWTIWDFKLLQIISSITIGDSIWQTIQDRIRKRRKDVITDIMDGKFYMKLCEEGQFLSCSNNISLIFKSDCP